jgi:Fe-S cluster assembly ATP-binding protein
MNLLQIEQLTASIEEKKILKQLDLSVPKGQIHAIMGPNGAGKSTLAKLLAGHPSIEVEQGSIWFKGQDLLALEPEQRAKEGLFMSFQYPYEIAGVTNRNFLQMSYRSIKGPISDEEFEKKLDEKMRVMDMAPSFKDRYVNVGFSGGEKKRNEILQMALLEPDLAILDETDSGLDIDAMKVVASGVNQLKKQEASLLVITHYQRLLDYIKPDVVHVFIDGKIARSGGPELALELEAQGYA